MKVFGLGFLIARVQADDKSGIELLNNQYYEREHTDKTIAVIEANTQRAISAADDVVRENEVLRRKLEVVEKVAFTVSPSNVKALIESMNRIVYLTEQGDNLSPGDIKEIADAIVADLSAAGLTEDTVADMINDMTTTEATVTP